MIFIECKNDIDSFKYFIQKYVKNINGGGTFTFDMLIDEYVRHENQDTINSLIADVKYLNSVLAREDWEIEKNLLDYILKHSGKTRMKKFVSRLLLGLTNILRH